MAKIVVRTQYYKGKKVAGTGKLLKYMATREGVEKLDTNAEHKPSTKQQDALIYRAFRHYPDICMYPEFDSYVKNMTKANASELLSAIIERNADTVADLKTLVHYVAERPGVEKLGSHGLFSDTDEDIDLEKAAEEVAAVNGIVFSDIISLRREDASRLGYDNAEAWKNCVRRNINEIAEAHKIPVSELKWYAAFHNTAHHPHIHLMVYSTKGNGYITEKGYRKLKSAFANDIFRNEQYKLFKLQTDIREELKDKFDEMLYDVGRVNIDDNLLQQFLKLAEQLQQCSGKKQYGYLPKDIKKSVDEILKALAQIPEISKLYSEWNRLNREKLSVYYDSSKNPDIPLEDNNEFKVLKNKIINYVLQMDMSQGENQTATDNTNKAIINDVAYMVGFFINTACSKRLDNLHSQLDEKEREKLLRKKRALGQKDGVTQDTKKEKDESESERAADNVAAIVDLGAAAINAAYESARAKREQQERLRQEAELQKQNYADEYYDDEDEDEGFTMTM
ncbi:MAG: hypothetical protein IKE65_01185 [Clostridia bacterium]|nr:hypothetical protein [Clostridia bacterium]